MKCLKTTYTYNIQYIQFIICEIVLYFHIYIYMTISLSREISTYPRVPICVFLIVVRNLPYIAKTPQISVKIQRT